MCILQAGVLPNMQVKPENVLYKSRDQDSDVMLVDFGVCSRLINADQHAVRVMIMMMREITAD